VSAARPLVACLCAAWCGACRDYRATFDALALRFAAVADFAWIDVEDESDALGDPEIENFPTLLIAAGGEALFCGPVTPQMRTAERLVQSAVAGELQPLGTDGSSARALAAKVRHLARSE
jgi:thiol-disulfide isomerase/thioredoxin